MMPTRIHLLQTGFVRTPFDISANQTKVGCLRRDQHSKIWPMLLVNVDEWRSIWLAGETDDRPPDTGETYGFGLIGIGLPIDRIDTGPRVDQFRGLYYPMTSFGIAQNCSWGLCILSGLDHVII